MKKWLIFAACLIAVGGSTCEIYAEPTGNINFSAGVLKTAGDFSRVFDIHERASVGASCDVKNAAWPVGIAFEYLLSYSQTKASENSAHLRQGTDIDIYCSEMFVGVKKIFDWSASFRPFACGGVHTVDIYMDTSCDDEFDSGIGVWIGAGFYFALSKKTDIGLEWKWSKTKIEVFDTHTDAGGHYFSLLIGRHF